MSIELISAYWYWYLALTLTAMAFGVFTYWKVYPPLTKPWNFILPSIRTAAIFCAGILIIEPLINLFSTELIKPKLAVFVDVSKSMLNKDEDITRFDEARRAVGEIESSFEDNYAVFSFADSLREMEFLPKNDSLTGEITSISQALTQFSDRNDLQNYGALILVTDGHQNKGDDPVTAAINTRLPVYTLTVGSFKPPQNIAIEDIGSPAMAYSGYEFEVTAEIIASGIKSGRSKIFLKEGSAIIAEQSYDIPDENRTVRIQFKIKASEPGDHEYAVITPLFPDEAIAIDNERIFSVKILKSKIRILLGASKLDWEYKFLHKILSDFGDFEVISSYFVEPKRIVGSGRYQPADSLENFDLIMLVDCSPNSLQLNLPMVKEYVKGGGAILYLAGMNALSDIRQFGDLLPISGKKPEIIEGDFYFETSAVQRQHAAVLLDQNPDLSSELWSKLPPFSHMIVNLETNGEILLESSGDQSGYQSSPIVITGIYGSGKVAAITGFPWWKSHFGVVEEAGLKKSIPTFFQNLCQWAASGEKFQSFKPKTDRIVYRSGEPIRFSANLYDETGKPRSGGLITMAINSRDSEAITREMLLMETENGFYTASLPSLPPDHYEYRASALLHDDTLGMASGSFAVEKYSPEVASAMPDYTLTRRISEATGGKAYDAGNFEQFKDEIRLVPFIKEESTQFRFFGWPIMLLIVLGALCFEWGMRKLKRLP